MKFRRRMFGFALLIAATSSAVGFVFGLTLFWTLPLLAGTRDEALHRAYPIVRTVIAGLVFLEYLLFQVKVPERRMAHVGVLFLLAQTLSWLGQLVTVAAVAAYLNKPFEVPPVSVRYTLIHAILAVLAVGVFSLLCRTADTGHESTA
jgi:hypothetical protein